MFKRLKRALVESFVGAVALGWIFANGIIHFAGIFASPVADWVTRSEYRRLPGTTAIPADLLLRDALPELIRSFLLLLAGYVLLRWLYFKPLQETTAESAANPEQAV